MHRVLKAHCLGLTSIKARKLINTLPAGHIDKSPQELSYDEAPLLNRYPEQNDDNLAQSSNHQP